MRPGWRANALLALASLVLFLGGVARTRPGVGSRRWWRVFGAGSPSFPNPPKPIMFVEGQTMKHHGIDHRKNGRTCANAQCQHRQGDQGERF